MDHISNMKSLLFDYFREMKNLLKLSLNDIEIKGFIYDRKKKRSKEKNVFLQYLPDIFRKIETIPTLIELDINHNFREIEESFFNSNKFKEIANNLPKQLLNLELFKDVEISKLGNYNNLVKNYQTLIDLGSYEPQHRVGFDFNYNFDYDNDYGDYGFDSNNDGDYFGVDYYNDIDDYTGASMGLWDWNND